MNRSAHFFSKKANSLVLGFLLLNMACFSPPSAERSPGEDSTTIHTKRILVGEVTSVELVRKARFPGVTRAAQRARLAFLTGGRMVKRPVEIGDAVRAGQELARLDDREYRNAVDVARAALDESAARRAQVERDVVRARRLVEVKAATAEELERIEAGLDALRAAEQSAATRLQDAERRLGETRLTAPFDGVITDVLREPGEMVAGGEPVVLLSGAPESGRIEVEVEVPASIVFALKEGDAAEVEMAMAGIRVEATVISVGRTAAKGRLFPVVLRLGESDLPMPGMSAEVVLRLAKTEGIGVPIEAVVDPGGRRPAVFRLSEEDGVSRVHKVRVEVGELLGERVLVRTASGAQELQAGDRVVIGGQRGLLDGDTVLVGAVLGDAGLGDAKEPD